MASKSTQAATIENISFALVRPIFLGNIGSTARLMKNFSFNELILVDPPKNYKDAEARKMAVGAFDILKKSRVFSDLEAAVADRHLVIGTTSGQQRALELEPFDAVISRAAQASALNKVVIVFGDERNGLTNDELSICHHLTRIPTNPAFPSLNVAQAACLVAYQLATAGFAPDQAETDAEKDQRLASGALEEELFRVLGLLLDGMEFSRPYNRDVVLKQLRRFYYRARPSLRELELLRAVVYRLNQGLGVDLSDK